MPPCDAPSLWSGACSSGNLSVRFISDGDVTINLADLALGSVLCGRSEEFRGRSVLVATTDQLTTALALIELDGNARRLVLCPPDLPREDLPYVIASAGVDAIVSDRTAPESCNGIVTSLVTQGPNISRTTLDRRALHETGWVLLTSGTTGRPKMVEHSLSSLAGAIETSAGPGAPVVWSTFYDIRRYGGLQIFLRAVLSGATLVLSHESTTDHLIRAGVNKVTHISGTPSHWRRALMSPSACRIAPAYIRLSGEIADQPILDNLRSFYPQAIVAHAFASTEAGVAFEVRDGIEGFPTSLMAQGSGEVEMKVEGGSLRIRSSRTASRYLGHEARSIADAEGFVNTGDIVECSGDRYRFVGRRDGVINVGGMKVHPEEVEAVINRHPLVRMSQVRTRKNSIMGGLVVADVILKTDSDFTHQPERELESEIVQFCRSLLPRHKVPAVIRFVSTLTFASTGKMARLDA